jgi:hypothetical protein
MFLGPIILILQELININQLFSTINSNIYQKIDSKYTNKAGFLPVLFIKYSLTDK